MPKSYKSPAKANNSNTAKPTKQKRANRRKAKPIPNAYISRNSTFYRTVRTSNNSVRVKGYDLVNPPVLSNPIEDSQFIFACISCNPAYWSGTRVASIAGAYSQYRPMKFNVHYFPQVATTTNGLITAGTIWDNDIRSNAFQQTLATSNGGRIHPVYVKSNHRVQLKTALSRNMFDINGFLNSETNPFTFVAAAYNYIGIVPGYYMVEWEFEFKNPVGEGATFESKYSEGQLALSDVWDNTTMVLAQTYESYPPGTTIQVRTVNSVIAYSINGTIMNDANALFTPSAYYLYRSYTGNTSTALIVKNLPEISTMQWSYRDRNSTDHNFVYSKESPMTIRRIADNLRDIPMTGFILWSSARPKTQEGWWPSVVIRLIDQQTIASLTDFDAYVIESGEYLSALRSDVMTRTNSSNLIMCNDGSDYSTTGAFSGSIKVRFA